MQHFVNELLSNRKNIAVPEEYNYFGKLIGSWQINYIDNKSASIIKGEWHFSWILDGMAIQDVIVLPNFERGTTLRIYNPKTNAWDIAYGFTGRIIRLEARRQGEMIVLTNIDDERKKWVFVKIEGDNFHWQDVTVLDDGQWYVNFDLYAKRFL